MKRIARQAYSGRRRGTILILVIWAALALVSLALYFGDTMLMEYRAADNAFASREADQAIEGARRYLTQVLTSNPQPGAAPDVASYENADVAVGDAQFWLIGRQTDLTQATDQPVFGLVDEASKLNLNTVTLDMLEALPGVTPAFAAAILDWRNPDSNPTPGGAESSNYLTLDPPYTCKNAPYETIEELRLVLGADMSILYGNDTNMNGVLDPNENNTADGKLAPGILEYVTVYSREPNKRADGTPRINILQNAAGTWQYLGATLGEARAAAVRARIGSSLTGIRSVLEFCVRGGLTAAEIAQVEDGLTVSAQSFIPGRVNVGTANQVVLACLPGIGVDLASKLVSARQGKSADDLKSVAWVIDVLGPDAATQAGPYITSRSYQFTANVAATGHNGRGFRRARFVFDTTGASPTIVYRRDLTQLGWPLGATIRKQLQTAGKS